MNAPPAMSFAFPKPGRALWVVLIALTVLGIFTALPRHVGPRRRARLSGAGLQARPCSALLAALAAAHLGAADQPRPLDAPRAVPAGARTSWALRSRQRWGAWRFARFLALSVIAGNLTVIAVARHRPEGAQARFHPAFVFGPTAAIAAIAIAWSREYAQSTVNLFFFLPVRGKVALLDHHRRSACSISSIRGACPRAWSRRSAGSSRGCSSAGRRRSRARRGCACKLALLRRRSRRLSVDDVLSRPSQAPPARRVRPRCGSCSGGLEEVLKKRTPPKDKRYLN